VKKSLPLILIPFVIFTYLSFIFFQKACDTMMYPKAKKEVPFNHKSHLTKYGTECEMCHGYDDNGRFLGLPSVASCTQCHDPEAEYDRDPLVPKRKSFLSKYKESYKPWKAHAKQPDLVYFSHKVVMSALDDKNQPRARCASCHGDKANSTNTKRIKGKMLMGQCMDCHTALKISNKCAVCHD